MNSIKELDSFLNQIIGQVNQKWNRLQKIRFVYLKLGEFLEKNTDFYLSKKLDTLKMKDSEISKIYNDDNVTVTDRSGKTRYQIICKSSSRILKDIYDKLGIESHLIHTEGSEDEILHWFLLVKDGENQYFLLLAADLPYIQNNFPTYHFANHINFFSERIGIKQYVIPTDNNSIELDEILTKDKNGNLIELKEIKHTVLAPTSYDSPEEYKCKMKKMIELDESIGYKKLYESMEFANSHNFHDLFYEYMESNSKIYEILYDSFNANSEYVSNIDDITEKQVINFKKKLNSYISTELNAKFNLENNENDPSNYEEYFKIYIQKMLNNSIEPCNTTQLLKKYKNDLKNTDYLNELNLIKTIINLEKKFDDFILYRDKCHRSENKINELVNKSKSISDINEIKSIENKVIILGEDLLLLEDALSQIKKQLTIPKLNPILNRVSLYFLKHIEKENSDGFIPNDYISNKFEILFPLIFDCNFKNVKDNHKTDFSIQGYSEQVFIVKEMLKNMFSELSINNCKQMPNYNEKLGVVDNRIRVFPLKDIESGEYSIGFRIWANTDYDEDEVEYIYIPSENLLRKRNPLKDRKYLYVSDSVKEKMDEIENIEDIASNKMNI